VLFDFEELSPKHKRLQNQPQRKLTLFAKDNVREDGNSCILFLREISFLP
jgi:hypothetical protein